MHFNSAHSALCFAYKQVEHLLMSQNNTLSLMQFIELKGVVGGDFAGLSQHDRLAQAAMIIYKVERVLEGSPLLLAAIRCQYGCGSTACDGNWHKGIMVLDAHYRTQYHEPKCDGYGYVLRSIFRRHPTKQDLTKGQMLNAFGWSLRTWAYRKATIRKDLGAWTNDAICILETVFEENGLISKVYA